MNKAEQITFLEGAFGEFETAEEKLKEFSLRIGTLNSEIKQLREMREKMKTERDVIIERCKSLVVDLNSISKSVQ